MALAWVAWVLGSSEIPWERGVTVLPGWEPLLPESEERGPRPGLAEEACVVCVRGYL